MFTLGNVHLKVGNTVVSIAYGSSAYCEPREDGRQDYTCVEVGLWSAPSEELAQFADGDIRPDGELTVYGYVPCEVLARFLGSLAVK